MIPIPIPIPSGISTTPIMDFTGLAPIANQELIGTNYVEIIWSNDADKATKVNKFIKLSPPPSIYINNIQSAVLPPDLDSFNTQRIAKMYTSVKIDLTIVSYSSGSGTVVKSTPEPSGSGTVSFAVNNARAIGNFGNSCYFGVAMHLLFVMRDCREFITTKWNISSDQALKNISEILTKMGGPHQAANPITMTAAHMYRFDKSQYMIIKKKYYPDPALSAQLASGAISQAQFNNLFSIEEDPSDMLMILVEELRVDGEISAIQQIRDIDYHTMAIPPMELGTNPKENRSMFIIEKNDFSTNPADELQNIMQTAYNRVELLEGLKAKTVDASITGTGKSEVVFCHRHTKLLNLPTYLLIKIASVDPFGKIPHDIKINLTLKFIGPQTKTYFFMGAIIHDDDY